ncbi:telomere repeat-binding protein 2 [Canna indica]|uniref:Telomere repeat-binding protein 2 n=1 Tax=Canna indica TaxID=4628 RepID=A0AAQ3JPH2_9LILI|nr:telomere repeat-binding protein 2 [Canna indica]
MVFQNRLDCGSSGYQAAVVPHVPRSARGKRSARKKVEDHQTRGIDLLANLASKLLSESESFPNSCHNTSISSPVAATAALKHEQIKKEDASKFEAFDQLSCNEDVLCPEKFVRKQMKDHFEAAKAVSSGPASLFVKSDVSDEDAIGVDFKFIGHDYKIGHGVDVVPEKYCKERLHTSSAESHESKDLGSNTTLQDEERIARDTKDAKASYMEDQMNLDAKSPGSGSSSSSIEVHLRRNDLPHSGSFHEQEDDMNLAVNKDDDDNSSGCTQSTDFTSKGSILQHKDDYHHRCRKLLGSRLWKVAPTKLQDDETANYGKKPALRGKRMCYASPKTPRRSFKRRKLFEHYTESACEGGIYRQENGAWSCRAERKPCYNSSDYHVKLSIKSFEVPELLVEIPETATVGSLKRTVLEAVTAILVDGLRVGVLFQGQKVTDDSKTLHQAGISQGDKLDDLGFILEPNTRQPTVTLTSSKDPHFPSLGCASEALARFQTVASSAIDQLEFEDALPVQTLPENNHSSVHSLTDASSPEKMTADSLALVAVPPKSVDVLAMVPLHNKPKSKRSEVAQRRVRRPFSVAEVEALVQAVEKLGTGRWRDVKLCAFENAKHRTYVDLKDKWKTLVHTARISPQQRRGEPVPQEFLDRVLSAHAYWSQQQARLQVKPPPAETCQLSYPKLQV